MGSLRYIERALLNVNWMELVLALLTILIIYGFKRITTAVPSTLVALVVVSSGAYFGGLDYRLIQEIPMGMPKFNYEIFTGIDFKIMSPFILSAFTLAMLGAIDSLLTSLVADNMTKTQHKPNQELIGQGIGNTIAAFFGGLPGAGATIRTVVNINSGGKTRLSGMMAGVFLFSIILVLGTIASKIPAGVLAGILITVGIGVMDYRGLKALPKMEWSEKIILLTVLILTVFWQLVFAVAVGLMMAAFVFLKRYSDASGNDVTITSLADAVKDNWIDGVGIDAEKVQKVYFKDFSGPLFFGIIEEFKNSVLQLPEIDYLIIRMDRVSFIDQSGLYALEETLLDLQKNNVVIAISGPNQKVLDQLMNVHIIPNFVSKSHVFHDAESLQSWLNDEISRS